jgi:hypothetical protein
MKINLFPLWLSTLILCLSLAPQVFAEQQEFEIKKVEATLTDTPQISGGSYRKQTQGRATPWLEADVTLDRKKSSEEDKLSGDVTVNFFILLKNKSLMKDGKPTLLKGSIVLTEIPEGSGLHAGCFVTPQTLSKYFEGKVPTTILQVITDVGVEIIGKDGKPALGTQRGTVSASKGWWDDTSQFDVVEGRVLSKDNTPFYVLSWDYYLPTKSKSAN